MVDSAIVTTGLTKRYRDRVAVDDVTMAVPAGRVTGFVGPNGAGKSTTIRMLLGLIRPSGGTARVLGWRLDQAVRYLPRVGALVEGPAFYARLSGRANLRVLGQLAGTASRIGEVLDTVGLADRADDPVGAYSLGMRQRLAIAAALLPDPALVVLDEPANGLDPAGIREIRQLLRALAERGVTVLVSSHQLSELEQVIDHLVLLRAGQLQYQGSLSTLVGRHPARVTARPEHPAQLDALAGLARDRGWPVHVEDGVLVAEEAGGSAAALNRLAAHHDIALVELASRPLTLEEIFIRLTNLEPAR